MPLKKQSYLFLDFLGTTDGPCNFENNNYKAELEVKVSLLEKENFELRCQLTDKVLIIKQLSIHC